MAEETAKDKDSAPSKDGGKQKINDVKPETPTQKPKFPENTVSYDRDPSLIITAND
jgi:hypothetical protein